MISLAPASHASLGPKSMPPASSTHPADAETQAWNLLDALDWPRRPLGSIPKLKPLEISIGDAISTTSPDWLQGSTFKSWGANESAKSAPWEDLVIPHFPDLNSRDGEQRTSEPISVVEPKKDQEMGMVRFAEWLREEGQPGSTELLQYYKDVRSQAVLMQEVKAISQGLHTTYFSDLAGNASFRNFSTSPAQCLPALQSAVLAMSSAEDEVLDRLYAREFKRFISGKITEQASACLGSFTDTVGRGDLGEIYCLADPRQYDTPLVYVSDGFCELSEYPRNRLVGRNCRFLQGPGTDPDAVRVLRYALREGKEHTSLLLNYTRTGKPFWNLLTMIPLRNAKGKIDFYLGAQINVTRALTSKKTFDALTGMAEKVQRRTDPRTVKIEFSEAVLLAAKGQPNPQAISEPSTPASSLNGSRMKSSSGLPSHETVSSHFSEELEDAGKPHRWYKDFMVRRPSGGSIFKSESTDSALSSAGTPIVQDVEASVKEHMANFASVYSKIIVFRARDRRITHITPALLAFLGYPVKTPKDRNASPLIGTDVLNLLASSSAAEIAVTRQIVAKSINESLPHSFFTGLASYSHKRKKRNDDEQVELTEAGKPFARGLLHLTPVKDVNDVVVSYVLLVG
ncbi:uncharacterized protein MKK02DRAFT_41212 [Dioszegia hungarica]|uniref:PAC domain-containing protein n=1 Tax=Dioszegia hungarica TaxID=4972 RepID=A0AA38LTS6_9TREE|nr:uncharacterized protein MKK02DRAFT_41212 [Dioszegia hungarica]KAI9632896.1 hypothetical protein MKK02DRAFT_41212 [Dioszegia hungarica]